MLPPRRRRRAAQVCERKDGGAGRDRGDFRLRAADLWPGTEVCHLQTPNLGLGRGSRIRPGFSLEEPHLFQVRHSCQRRTLSSSRGSSHWPLGPQACHSRVLICEALPVAGGRTSILRSIWGWARTDLCGGSGLALTSRLRHAVAHPCCDPGLGNSHGVPDSPSDSAAVMKPRLKPTSGQAPDAHRVWAGGLGPQVPWSSSWRSALKGTQRWGQVGVVSTPSARPLGSDHTRGLAFLREEHLSPQEEPDAGLLDMLVTGVWVARPPRGQSGLGEQGSGWPGHTPLLQSC